MNKKTLKKSLTGFIVIAIFSGLLGTASLNLVANASETEVGGIINADTTWTLVDSPYVIVDTIQIPAGVTLTIEPGVIINKPTNGDMFLLNGTIYAHGTTDNRIIFDGGSNSNFFSAKNSDANTFLDLDYSIIKNGISFWPSTSGTQYGHFNLRHSLMENLSNYSYIWYPQKDVYIEYNEFRNSGGFSVGHGGSSIDVKVYIRYNLFNEKNLNLPDYANYCIENWASYDLSETIVEYNSFIGIDDLALKLPSGYNSAALTATNNYWDTQDIDIINSMIYDKNDDITCAGYIDYLPILIEPHPDTPIASNGVCSLADGSLVRKIETPEVYLIENCQKRWIVDPVVFVCGGYNWEDVISVSNDELNNCPTGENITTPTGCGGGGSGGESSPVMPTVPVVTIDKLITNDTTPELTGTIDNVDDTIAVIVVGNEYGAVNNGDGTWTLADDTINELRIGIYDVEIRAVRNYVITGYDNTTNELTIKSDEEKPSYAVAIDNQKNARPVSGVDEADVIYEFPVEGSITRFMAIYNPDSGIDFSTQIGPVRSARPYFARTASEHKAIYAHAGGIPDALSGLSNHEYSVYNLDALYGGSDYFWRDENREMPHNLYTSIENLNNFRNEFELGSGTFTQPWIFSDTPSSMEDIGFDQSEAEVEYANQDYNVKWIYDDTDGVYYRQSYEDGSYQDYIDINDNHVSTVNLAIQYANTDPFTEIWQMEGGALLCREGKCVNGRWQKDDLDSNVKFYLLSGEEFEFKTGKLWINVATDIIPPRLITDVTVENVSTENELGLKINWVNPMDEDLARIVIYRSNMFSPSMWNFIGNDYVAPDTTSIIDSHLLAEGVIYYYKLYAVDTAGNWSEWSEEEALGIPLYDQPIEHGIRIDDITWIRNFGATNDTYIDGWKLKFDITVNDPEEDQLKFKMSDWASDSNTIATLGNTKISLVNLNTEADILNATSMGIAYDDMDPLTISDINPLMDKTQASFYIWIKLPTNTVAGSYRTNYGIQILTQ